MSKSEFLFNMADLKDKEIYFEVWLDNDNIEDSGLGKKFLGIFKEYDLAVIFGNSIVALWREKIVVYRMCREDGEVLSSKVFGVWR